MKTSNFCMKVDRSNLFWYQIRHKALMFSYKANAICMADMTMPTGAGVAASHCWNRVLKPGQLINYALFWPHRWTFAKLELHMLRPLPKKYTVAMGQFRLVKTGLDKTPIHTTYCKHSNFTAWKFSEFTKYHLFVAF